MRFRPAAPWILLAAVCLSRTGIAGAQPAGEAAGRWPLETVTTDDDRVYQGLVHSRDDRVLEFIEVVRPRGKPMHLVVRPIEVRSIASVQRLPLEERTILMDRVQRFRCRSRIEAGRMEDVELVERRTPRRAYLHYRGPWFLLDSTSDDETTRRCVVRIEQIFRAYRQLLPPRIEPTRPLRILLLASMDEYRGFLSERGLELENAAVFSEAENLIAAGSELTRFARRLEEVRARHQRLRREYQRIDRDMPRRLAAAGAELRAGGLAKQEVDKELDARRALWNDQFRRLQQQLNAADRRNEAKFAEVTQQMFRRLYHEGFHAHLENLVYPHDDHDVPVWLNEGLAQVFQSGQVEADTLRIDAPLAPALDLVQREVAAGRAMPLTELLASSRQMFLDAADKPTAVRHYAYAWALAYYLTFNEPLLGGADLDQYLAVGASDASPTARFEQLVGRPVERFEAQWLEAIAAMRPAPQSGRR